MHDAEKLIALCDRNGDFDDTSEYQLLIRLLKERTILDDDGASVRQHINSPCGGAVAAN